jgi:hypothetical protein
MKRIFIFVALLALCLMAEAQWQRVPSLKRTQTEKKQQKSKSQKTVKDTVAIQPVEVKEEDSQKKIMDVAGYKLICDAVENAFIVVRQKYNVRKDGINVSGNDFFGEVYSVLPILKYGYNIDCRYQKPWVFDSKAAQYGNCSECVFSVDVSDYRRLSDKKFKSFDLKTEIADTIASGIYFIRDSFMNNNGMNVVTGNGIRDGYMVWFRLSGDDEIQYEINPMTIIYNENFIFPLEQPKNVNQIIGGMFIKLNTTEPGCIKVDLIGTARLEPYEKKKWELVKLLSTTSPMPESVQKDENVENDKASESKVDKKDKKEDSIIPDEGDTHNKKSKSDKKKKSTN